MVRHILATSLTTEYNLFFSFARWEGGVDDY